jgi:hypothetical protein
LPVAVFKDRPLHRFFRSGANPQLYHLFAFKSSKNWAQNAAANPKLSDETGYRTPFRSAVMNDFKIILRACARAQPKAQRAND